VLIITDINGNTEGLTGYTKLKRYRNVSGEKSLAFLVLPTAQNAHSFGMITEESIVEFAGESYRIKQLAEKSKGRTFYKEVVAVHAFFDLIDDHVYALHNGSLTFAAALNFALNGSGYTWSIIDSFGAEDFENFGDDNRLALLQTILSRYGAEFTLNGTHITLRKRIGNATDFQFRYNYNVKTLARDVNTNNLSTYIKGFGAGIESEYTSPNAAIFGTRHAKPVRDDRYTTLEGLNARLVAELNDEPDVSITIDFADMRRAGYPYDVPNEGDDVFLIYEPIGIDVEARLVDVEEEFTEASDLPIATTVTLANIRSTVIDRMANTEKTVRNIIGSDGNVRYNVLDGAVKRATEALQSAQTELEFENGIIARSKVNPNHLVLMNSAGIGISTDGGQTFADALIAGGVVTSALTAGQIHTNNIQIIGDDDLFYWDGNALMAIDAINPNKFVRLNSDGMYSARGAMTVERPDGYKTVNDGYLNIDYTVQSTYPPYTEVGVNQEDYWLTLTSTTYKNLGYFNFKHEARYLKIVLYTHVDNASNLAAIRIEDANSPGTYLAFAGTTSTDPGGQQEIITLDFGVPTGARKSFLLQMRSTVASEKSYARILQMYLEG
jgi:phage minor structural protein